MARTTMSEDEKRWRREEDARILKRAMEIQNNATRRKEAEGIIQKELKELASLTGNRVVKKSQMSRTNPSSNRITKKKSNMSRTNKTRR